jgi:hypothetical protein
MRNSSATKFVLPAAVLVLFLNAASAATYDVGSGYPYPRIANLPSLVPGDIVQIHSGTYNEVKRWTQSGTSSAPITIRGVGATRPVIDANGLTVDGAMPNPRAAFQIEAAYIVIENLELKNAHNGNNGAGIRVTSGGNNAIVRNCVIDNNDMGMMSDSSDNLLVESCEVAFNGTSAFSGYCHNFYLSGTRVTVRYCYIHDSIYGQNFKTRGHYTELLYNYIADSSDGEIGFVDSALTTTANSNAVMIGNIVVSKDRGPNWNSVKFVQFGQDGGNAHTGTLYAFNNTFIAGTNRITFLDANASGSSIMAGNNIFYGSGNIASGTINGSNNWVASGAAVPSGLINTTVGSSPGFVSLAARDFHLAFGSSCINIGAATLTCADGSGATFSGVPNQQYVNHLQSIARVMSGSPDAGAYEFASAVVAPSITTQPANQTVTAGQTATFSVAASGTAPLSYQWQKNAANISGATGASYTTPATTTADSGAQFRCIVSNSAGTATSNAATLTVNAAVVAPSITTQPANQTVTAGQTATFSVAANGTAPLSYQWQKNAANISGATGASYTTPATTTADSGATFRCVVSNSAGSATSNAATLTVNAAVVVPSITTQPANQTVTAGQTASFSVAAGGTAPLSYQWQKNAANISGATGTSYTTPATTTADSGAQFRCIVSNSAGSATSNAATLTVNAAVVAPSITTQPANQTVTAGQTATFSVAANGTAPLAYQWQKNAANISGATSASYTTPTTTTADSGAQFRCIVSNSAGSATSNAATLTVNSGGFTGNGTGLNADYFDNMDFTGTKFTRVDSTVNFDWASGSPDASIGVDTFSARWTGEVQPRFSEALTFYTVSDDGIRLWVNGQLVIDNWTDHGPTENASAPVSLVAGSRYAIKMEFYENGGGAVAKLLWSSASQPKGVIPQTQLYPTLAPIVGNGNGLLGQYYDNADFTNLKLSRTDATVNFDWSTGAPDASMGVDLFSVRWTGQVQPKYSGIYTFYTVSDDGIRLSVNGQQIINNWTDHAPTENSGTISLVAGQKYSIQMDFYENGGGAVAKLLWSSANDPKAVVPQSQLYSSAPAAPVAQTASVATAPTTNLVAKDSASTDDDNDGLLNDYELSVGLDPHSADSDGNGVADADELTSSGLTHLQAQSIWQAHQHGPDGSIEKARLKASVQFASVGKDALTLMGLLPAVPAPGANAVAILDVGGLSNVFKLSAKGAARTAAGKFSLTGKANKPLVLKAQLKGSLATIWTENGIVSNTDEKNAQRHVSIELICAGKSYAASIAVQVSARKDRGARLKN